MTRTAKKQISEAERVWREWDSHERWERRVEYLMEFFSPPSGLLRTPTSSHRPAPTNRAVSG